MRPPKARLSPRSSAVQATTPKAPVPALVDARLVVHHLQRGVLHRRHTELARLLQKDADRDLVQAPDREAGMLVDVDPDVLARLAGEKAQVEAQIAAVQQARATAMIDVNRTSQLYAEGLAARRDYEQTQIKVADVDAKLAEARAKLKQIEIKLAQSSAQIVSAPREGRVQDLNAAAGGAEFTINLPPGPAQS